MQNSEIPDAEILKSVLEPLLEDFQYWFERSRDFLEKHRLSFMNEQEQSDMLSRVKQAQAELNSAKMLFTATDGQVALDMATIQPWHSLVTEYWIVAQRFHYEQSQI
ncbi:hypothetical protein CLI64_24775 [Nostoc sp. CENA543]|uniref:DUF2605 domain-containing protein n=1 Tax=Nostoc sp. CENA543 TaxID=1869241 RepID=UPI000CA3D083|nr:DUF2605 domain-containing protein [Nostoc sp. CENA543]AUT03373.1 hypothetical protein CLI64_24775 [Nostoc sp. CENA543]